MVGRIDPRPLNLVFTIGLIVFSIDLVRARVIPIWVAPVLVLGGFATIFFTPTFLLPGLAPIGIDAVVVQGPGRRASPACEVGNLAVTSVAYFWFGPSPFGSKPTFGCKAAVFLIHQGTRRRSTRLGHKA